MNPILARMLVENPVVVTGMGAFCAAGQTANEVWDRAAAGKSTAVWREFGCGDGTRRFAVCPAGEPGWRFPELGAPRKLDRCVQLALAAAGEAWEQAGLRRVPLEPERLAVFCGTSRGPIGKWQESMEALGRGRMLPSLALGSTLSSLSGALSLAFGARGVALTISAACASGASAIALGAQQIASGLADVALVGGAEAPLLPVVLRQLEAAGVLGVHGEAGLACRPFDVTRNGLVVGEGAGFLVLESAVHAKARGARVCGHLSGWGLGSESAGRTGLEADGAGLRRVMEGALATAGVEACDLDYLNAHGTGTVLNDVAEARAVNALGAAEVPCSSTKAVTGHCLGATPALEAVLALKAIERQQLPPSANCEQPDPACALNLVRGGARGARVRRVMSNSLGFWGSDACLIFSGSG